MQPTKLEAIGAGTLARGQIPEGVKLEHPLPLRKGTALGQHLRIERLVRVVEGRQLYLANNVDPLWAHKKCWHCGNRYNPNVAQACSYCGTPLREQRFLASVRHDTSTGGWESWLKLRLEHAAIATAVAAFYRDGLPVTVFPYYGESLLIDQPGPLPGPVLVPILHRLSTALGVIHEAGVRLAPFTLANVVIMPDRSPRFTDLEALEVLGASALARHPDRPIFEDVRTLCSLLLRLADPGDLELVRFLRAGVEGHHGPPKRLCAGIEQFYPKLVSAVEEPTHAGLSDVGLARATNEDAWGWRRLDGNATAYVVADGLGGQTGGAVAAKVAVNRVLDSLQDSLETGTTSEDALKRAVTDAIASANELLVGFNAKKGTQMGCTLAILLLATGGHAYVAHAGDTRIYLRRGPTLRRVTEDHSLVQAMVERGTVKPAEARTHPKANVLLNFVGQEEFVDIDVEVVRTLRGDRWLICTDGLWAELSDQEIRWELDNWSEPRRCVQKLVQGALDVGGKDNVTVMVIDVTS